MNQQRIEERLKKLRQRFTADVDVRQVNKDFEHLTADHVPTHLQHRTFFMGECFWVAREGWTGCGGFGSNESREHHPGLVIFKQARPFIPVTMAPGTTRLKEKLEDGSEIVNFVPQEEPAWAVNRADLPPEQAFVLNYIRPVARLHVTFRLATLRYRDRERLQVIVLSLRKTHNVIESRFRGVE